MARKTKTSKGSSIEMTPSLMKEITDECIHKGFAFNETDAHNKLSLGEINCVLTMEKFIDNHLDS